MEQAGLGEVIDAQALTAYRRRLAEIDTELDEADASGDAERSAKLTTERHALLAELSAATGLGGRPRTSGSGAERARVRSARPSRPRSTRSTAQTRWSPSTSPSHVRTGLRCSYQPDPDARG